MNHPEVGILGLHRVGPRPAVVAGELAVREIGWLACTFDHRVVDGARASVFLLDVIGRLEAPDRREPGRSRALAVLNGPERYCSRGR